MNSLPSRAVARRGDPSRSCISNSCLTSVRPMPRPPSERAIVRLPWANSSKTWGRSSGVMPIPVSRIAMAIWLPTRRARPGSARLRWCTWRRRSMFTSTVRAATGRPRRGTRCCPSSGSARASAAPAAAEPSRSARDHGARFIGCLRSVIRPLVMRLTSSRSSISRVRSRPGGARRPWPIRYPAQTRPVQKAARLR